MRIRESYGIFHIYYYILLYITIYILYYMENFDIFSPNFFTSSIFMSCFVLRHPPHMYQEYNFSTLPRICQSNQSGWTRNKRHKCDWDLEGNRNRHRWWCWHIGAKHWKPCTEFLDGSKRRWNIHMWRSCVSTLSRNQPY